MSQALAELKALTTDQPAAPLRPKQIQAYEGELKRLGALRDSRDMDGKPAPWIGAQNADAARQIRRIHKTLDEQAPKKLTGERANRAYRKAKEVLETVIKPAMLTTAVMHRAPSRAVGHYMRNENSPYIKDAILTWKRTIRALVPDDPDPDVANHNAFRPDGSRADGTATFMGDAMIPGYHAMTPLAKANWPEGLAEPQNTAVKQAQRAQRAHGTKKTAKAKRPMTEAQRAAGAKMHAALSAKRAAAQGRDARPTPPAAGD